MVTVFFVFMQILAWSYSGKYWMAAFGAAALVSLLWGCHFMEDAKRKNFELLKQLKAKYGPEIYDEIKQEPDSLQYKIFQKSYPPERQPPSVNLP